MARTDIGGVLSYTCNYWNYKQDAEPPLYPYCVEEVDRLAAYSVSISCVNYLVISIVTEGEIHYQAGNFDGVVKAGECIIIPVRSTYRFESHTTGGSYKKHVLELKGTALDEIAGQLNLNTVSHFPVPDVAAVIERLQGIGKKLSTACREDIPAIMGDTWYLLYYLSELAHPADEPPEQMRKIMNEIDASVHLPVSVKSLQEKFRVSHSVLDRMFRAHLGLSVSAYWISRKMLAAEYLLKNTELSIKEIAFRLGYSSQFHFSSQFRRKYHCPPLEFRKQI